MTNKTRHKSLALAVAAGCITLGLTACTQPSTESAAHSSADQPIRIGATMSQSGAYATQGRAAKNGYRLCERDLNASSGVLGRQVEFVIHDDESDSEKVQALYESLISETEVDLIIGPYGSTLTEALAPVTEAHRMVHITPLAATSSIWEQGREYLFMVLPPAELFLAGLIDLADAQGYQRVAVLHEDALFPQAAAQGARDEAEERGMQVVSFASYPSGQTEFDAMVEQLAADEVEVLAMAASNLDDFVKVQRALKAHGVELKMFGTSGAVQEFADALGNDADGVFGLSAWEPSAPNPGADEFTAAYQQKFGQAPAFHSAGAYASCQLLAQAVEQAGSLEQDAIRRALLDLDTTTVFGGFKVDERGYQIAHEGLFIQWQDGHKEVVWPSEVATSEPRWPADHR
ncbi:MAG: amino acid ABC transporter substrate-binding protein [Idiomarina sp.]|nr:amino acid ABC transporter substrate-binding protein [Idiomarina sp.]